MAQEIKFFKLNEITNITVSPEIEYSISKTEETPEVKNFWGKIITHYHKGGYYSYGRYYNNLEDLIIHMNNNDKYKRYLLKDGKIYVKSILIVNTLNMENKCSDTIIQYFDTFEEALSIGNLIANQTGLICIPNF